MPVTEHVVALAEIRIRPKPPSPAPSQISVDGGATHAGCPVPPTALTRPDKVMIGEDKNIAPPEPPPPVPD